MKSYFALPLALLGLILMSSFASAVVISSVDYNPLFPGTETDLVITIKNDLDSDIEDVSLSLDFSKVPLAVIGSSEESVDEIREDKREDFNFRIRPSSEVTAGDYIVPYTLIYSDSDGVRQPPKQGSITIAVSANTDLTYTVSAESPVVGKQGKISLRIVNKGFADAKFVSVKIFPDGYTLLSEDEVYIGTISSDDFETATFDVIFSQENPEIVASVDYTDFDNQKRNTPVALPLTVYSQERALELGIIQRSYTLQIVIAIVVVIVLWFVWRSISKRRRLKRSMQQGR